MATNSERAARELALGACFCALGVAVPILFHVVGLGRVFLPMHLPVLIAGLLLRPRVAMAVGVLTPWASMLFTGMPPLPNAVLMSLELAVLAGAASLLMAVGVSLWIALPLALLGRIAATWLLTWLLAGYLGLPPQAAGWASVAAGAPGVLLQLVVAPLVVLPLRARARR